ncbi:MAG: DNA-binding protein [Herpetosiphonaceae bacterium]|nr:MAG: DNA-binding protein [Herpetosiphonaceae bacterium]
MQEGERIQSKAARLRRIEHKLYNAPHGMRVVELAAACGVDRRTIYRDLQLLEDMGVPVWEDRGRYGINRQDYLSTVRLNLNETIALYFATRLLAHHSDEHNPHVVSALDKIAAAVPDEMISAHLARTAELIRQRPLRRTYIQTLEMITRAWADRRWVRLQYWAAGREHAEERTVAPYFLEVSRFEPASYLIGYDKLRQAIRTFKLERVQAAAILPEAYELPEDFDPHQWLAGSWGIMAEDEVEIRLAFSPAVARRVKESLWHRSQQVEDLPDGGCILTFRVGGIREIRSWVLSWGADVVVLAPDPLREEVASHARRMADLYLASSEVS